MSCQIEISLSELFELSSVNSGAIHKLPMCPMKSYVCVFRYGHIRAVFKLVCVAHICLHTYICVCAFEFYALSLLIYIQRNHKANTDSHKSVHILAARVLLTQQQKTNSKCAFAMRKRKQKSVLFYDSFFWERGFVASPLSTAIRRTKQITQVI